MKIAYLSGSTLPSARANAIHVVRMCAALTRAGHSVTLVARDGGSVPAEIFSYYGIADHSRFNLRLRSFARWPILRGLSLSWSLASYVGNHRRPDLFYSRYPLLAALASLTGVGLVYEVHAMPKRRLDRLIEAVILSSENLRRVVAISQTLKDDYVAAWPKLEGIIVVAHDAADPSPTTTTRQLTWPGRPSAPQVGYVGSLYPGKGVEIVVQLAKRLPDIDFHIVGGKPEDLARWQDDVDVTNLYLHGHVPHRDVQAYYSRFHVALAPVQRRVAVDFGSSDVGRWTSPLKVFEYMAAGLPTIASDVPTLREILKNGETAVLVPPDDLSAWVTALRNLVENGEDARRLGDSARRDLEQHHTWDARAAKVLRDLP